MVMGARIDHASRRLRGPVTLDRVTRIALAILGGCALIAIAVFLALWLTLHREPPPAAPIPTAAAPPDADTLRALTIQAAGQLEKQRAPMTGACLRGERTPTRYDLQLAFDPAGHEIGRSLLELRDPPSRPDIAACLRALTLPPIVIGPPGTPVTLTIPLVLP